MRIIGGRLGGRRIDPPSKHWPVRPTTDFAREALFNILDNRLEYTGIAALDLFGGIGMHALELASRGCPDVTYVDRHRASAAFMRKVSKELDLAILVVEADVRTFLRTVQRQWDYIFADPPYDMVGLAEFPALLMSSGAMSPGGLFVLEHGSTLHFRDHPGFREERRYGQSVFSFFTSGS
jgi:16S rRNA (guanine(966)-N(2))-methyltransferase RsmD